MDECILQLYVKQRGQTSPDLEEVSLVDIVNDGL